MKGRIRDNGCWRHLNSSTLLTNLTNTVYRIWINHKETSAHFIFCLWLRNCIIAILRFFVRRASFFFIHGHAFWIPHSSSLFLPPSDIIPLPSYVRWDTHLSLPFTPLYNCRSPKASYTPPERERHAPPATGRSRIGESSLPHHPPQ